MWSAGQTRESVKKQAKKNLNPNIEAVSKLASYPGGLYSLAAATISTVTVTRIMSLEILTCVNMEGGADGHYKVSEAISTLRLRMGEPVRCKLLVGALSSAAPGTFQAKGIRFLTSWVASAPSPKHKVHIQCELEEAGFNPQAIRKGAELGGARESREVQSELDEWDRVSIDVDTLTRQNCQLRNSVATLQQELATLKDKLKRMDIPQKQEKSAQPSKRSTRPKRSEEMVTTPADSEEEAEQIHQILEDLNNIVNSEMNGGVEEVRTFQTKKEKEIVPTHLVKSPPKRSPGASTTVNMANHKPRPWPGSSASDDDDSDILEYLAEDNKAERQHHVQQPHEIQSKRNSSLGKTNQANVRRAVEQLEKTANNGLSPKLFQKNSKYQNQLAKQLNIHSPNSNHISSSANDILASEPKPDYTLPNFHKQNHMASKFANFKSSKLYSSSPDNSNSSKNYSNSYAEVYEKSSNSNSSRYNFVNRFSPHLEQIHSKKNSTNTPGLRRSESLHASLASVEADRPTQSGSSGNNMNNGTGHQGHKGKHGNKGDSKSHSCNYNLRPSNSVLSWKSMENLENSHHDENFTLRWRYPHPQFQPSSHHPDLKSLTPSPKNSKGKTHTKIASAKAGEVIKHIQVNQVNGDLHLIADYRQNRFTKNSKTNIPHSNHAHQHPQQHSGSRSQQQTNHNVVNNSSGGGNGSGGLFARYAKKPSDKPIIHLHPQQQHIIPPNNQSESQKEKENIKMFSLPPIPMTTNDNCSHRICDLPSGLY